MMNPGIVIVIPDAAETPDGRQVEERISRRSVSELTQGALCPR